MRGRAGAALATMAVTMLAATMLRAQQAPAIQSAAPAHPLITRYVDVGGRRVAFHVAAGRSPAILFIAGGGEDGSA